MTTVGVVDPASETWYLRNENSAGMPDVATPFRYGLPGWKPVAGDWNADGRTGIGVCAPDGTWYLRDTASAGSPDITPFAYGLGTWTPMAGTWSVPSQAVLASGGTRTPSLDFRAPGPSDLAAAVNGPLGRLTVAGVRRTQALDQVFASGGFSLG
jgi:hypothetical protein